MKYNQLKEQIEQQLYTALEALENDDLIAVRQQAARAVSDCIEAWNIKRTAEAES